MSHLNKVAVVENPHIAESFKMFKGPNVVPRDEALQSICISARIHLENTLISGLIQSVDSHRNVQSLEMKRLVNIDLTNKVVVSCPICYNYMVGNETLDKVKHLVVTRHVALDDRVILLDMTDDTKPYLVDYSLDMVSVDKLDDDVIAELMLNAQFYLKSKSGNDYHCTYPEA